MRFALRRWWRWLSALLTMLFVLVACGQGDSPLTVRPVADGSATDSVPLMRTEQVVVLTEAETAFRVDYSVRSQWQEGFVADVTIQNLGDPIDGWTLDWIFPSDQIQITNLWNGQLTQDGANVSVQDLGWNARIPSNGEITFGFEARYRGTDVIPSAFALNGITLGNPTPAPLPAACEVTYQIRTQWEQGFVADLQLRNLGSAVTNWELSWAFPVEGVEITNLWNGQLAQNGREVKVTNLDWNATLAPQQQLDLGFQAAYPGGGVTPTEFYLNGLLCNGLPASPGTPTPDGSGDSPAQILNAADIDGIPLTIGQSITLQGSSPAIEWRDSTGRVLGQGSQLVYQAQAVGMETITAQIGQTAQSRVSFTVSTPDVVLQTHVKVLGDELAAAVESFDPAAGILVLRRVPGIPTLEVGDVVVGAGLRVRPAEILALTETEAEIQAQIQLALPRQVIKQGSIAPSQWQRVVIGSEGQLERVNPASLARSGACDSRIDRRLTVPLPGIPSQTFTIDIPLPFPGFQQLQSSLTAQLDAQVVAEAGFCPLFEPPQIDFQEQGNLFSGIRRFEMGAGLTDISAQTYLELNGLATWSLIQRFPNPAQELINSPVTYVGNLGPVSVWVGFDVLGSIPVEAGAELSVNNGRVGVAYSGGRFVQRLRYEDGSGWDNTPEFDQGQFSRILEGEIDLDGFLKVGINPEIEAEIWGSVGPAPRLKLFTLPKIGLNVYAKAELDLLPEDVTVQISQPQAGATLDGREGITLNASVEGDPQLRLLAGVDFTLRDGRVEDAACPVDFSAQSDVVNLSLTDSPNFGSPCEQAPINPSGNRYPCVPDPRTGQNIPYPFAAGQEPPARIPRSQRLSRNPNKYKRDYVCVYNFEAPQVEGKAPWEDYQIHHKCCTIA